MVSYLEVPLRSTSGHIIGSYCVVDNRLRDFVEPKALGTMREVTAAISSYLDMKRAEASRTRSEKMMDGLRQFIDSERDTYSLGNSEDGPHTVSRGPFDLHVSRQTMQVDRCQKDGGGQSPHLNDSESQPLGQTGEDARLFNRAKLSDLGGPSTTAPVTVSSHSSTTTQSSARQPVIPNTAEPSSLSSGCRQDTPKPHLPDLATQISDLFAKASDMIGYALSLDGLTFFDATSDGAQYRSNRTPSMSTDFPPWNETNHELAKPLSEYRSQDAAKRHLKILPTQSLIKRLTSMYPQGHVFAMDEYGVFKYGDKHTDDVGTADAKESRTSENWDELFECIPDARYVAFLPLWHYQREACFATCLAWVTDTSKTLEPADINSLIGFGNSLIAEIMRLEAFTNTQSKSDFISSISHELRSPLHGILATVELMQQSATDPGLLSLVNMVESCSNTLLHTFDHLLEFTRINSRTNNERRTEHDTVKSELVDLGMLVEDVLETASLGHSSAQHMHSDLEKEQRTASIVFSPDVSPPPVLVTTYIEKNRNWTLPLDKGAWKRILLNLCSNALKYTVAGHIEVALSLLEGTESECTNVSLSVTDTGIGMSQEFLKHHLFTPFTQENILTPGTGLGLSLVKSIVESIQGKIFIESCLHEGTRVTVNVPLEPERESPDQSKVRESFKLRNKLQGLSLGMLSITSDGAGSQSKVRITNLPKALEQSIRNICEETYSMIVTDLSAHTVPNVDVILVETQSSSVSAGFDLDKLFPEASARPHANAVVVIGPLIKHIHNIFDAREATSLTSPITRKRLHDALTSALDQAKVTAPSLNFPGDTLKITTSLQDVKIKSDPDVERARLTDSPHEQTSAGIQDLKGFITPLYPPPSQNNSTLDPALTTSPTNISRFKRYLLVDDNPINLKVLSAFVRRLHAPFSFASNGAEAVHLYKQAILKEQDPFDICFMDISMPVQNGFQAVAAIREFEDEQKVDEKERCYVLALTGLGSDGAREEARSAGFDGFLLKPVKFGDILPQLQE
jgi:signal transduction histidine kinase/ActR/RegA family two-component response regulator